jgi:hypothetical protein
MEVILKEDVANLGHRGDVVKVADGYGRNFLLPRKLALQATLANKAVIEQMKSAAVRRSAEERVQAQELLAKLDPSPSPSLASPVKTASSSAPSPPPTWPVNSLPRASTSTAGRFNSPSRSRASVISPSLSGCTARSRLTCAYRLLRKYTRKLLSQLPRPQSLADFSPDQIR